MSATSVDRRELLEYYGRVYGTLGLAITFSRGLEGDDAKRLGKGWPDTRPLPDAGFGAGLLAERGQRRNPAVVLRPSGLIGVECDGREAVERFEALGLPDTVTVQSSAPDRLHFWFRPWNGTPPRYVSFRFEPSGITREENRGLLVPPAVHPGKPELGIPPGRIYEFRRSPEQIEVAVMPEAQYDELVRLAKGDDDDLRQALANNPDAKIPEGRRRETIFKSACADVRFGLSRDAILDAARALNRERCDPPLTDEQVVGQVDGAINRYPSGTALEAVPPRPEEPDQDPDVPAWHPVSLTEAAASDSLRIPDRFHGLAYPDTELLVSSEPGVGKSMLLAAIMGDEARAGRTPLYLDFERTAGMLYERLETAGFSEEEIARVLYLRPTAQASSTEIRTMVEQHRPSLVAVDSYDAALAAFGRETKNEDVRVFHREVIAPLRSTGALTVIADHVTKNRDTRGRYTIGGQAKLALADVHLGLSALVPLRRGSGGKLKIHVHKDTYGWLPRTGLFELAPNDAGFSWHVRTDEEDAGEAGEFRPTGLMERVSRQLEIVGKPLSRNQLAKDVKGKGQFIRQAIDVLIREGFAKEEEGPNRARLVSLVRPFREDDDG